MEHKISNKELAVASLLGTLHACIISYVYKVVPQPYMDEEFHINQTRSYCNGDYLVWNAKITTPPALYLLTVPMFCGVERYLNTFILPLYFIGLCLLRKRWVQENCTIITALNALMLPVLFDTSILFYTDLLSVTAVVWGFYLEKKTFATATCFAIAILTRQTNIVWAAMFCATLWLQNVNKIYFIRSTMRIILKIWPFVGLGAAFLIFISINKGIVLGDKKAHKPVFHAAQFLYFLGFVGFSSAPIFTAHVFSLLKYSIRKPFVTLLLIVLFIAIVNFSTLSHPYLLADNRHFTFYLWRKFLDRNWFCRYLPIPLYVLSFFYMQHITYFASKYALALFIICTCVCIIPAQLIEFRYFIIPYVLWRLSVKESRRLLLYLELIWSLFITIIALYLFFNKPFVWSHDPTGAIQRFMW